MKIKNIKEIEVCKTNPELITVILNNGTNIYIENSFCVTINKVNNEIELWIEF